MQNIKKQTRPALCVLCGFIPLRKDKEDPGVQKYDRLTSGAFLYTSAVRAPFGVGRDHYWSIVESSVQPFTYVGGLFFYDKYCTIHIYCTLMKRICEELVDG